MSQTWIKNCPSSKEESYKKSMRVGPKIILSISWERKREREIEEGSPPNKKWVICFMPICNSLVMTDSLPELNLAGPSTHGYRQRHLMALLSFVITAAALAGKADHREASVLAPSTIQELSVWVSKEDGWDWFSGLFISEPSATSLWGIY